ncbi:MAG: patatin-like phospholipase family protein [Ilumatobacteraceae bacterium]|nr:patatin-like phospholipase family protein [Ilumatobacter sp.]MCO5330332.1 patatin-like phospholipase family protein [Ilumatobacteraceae bacterium]
MSVTPEAEIPAAQVAFVLGGGGKWGAVEVGMLRALVERGIRPDVVLGCSIGAINGAWFAADPTAAGVDAMQAFWQHQASSVIADAGWMDRVRSVVGRKPSLFESASLRDALAVALPAGSFEALTVPFQCVAACIDDASETWFTEGPLVEALVASSAIPGLLPPAEVAGRHYYDGGLVNSIPLDRAVALGCTEVYVLQVGRVEQSLPVPRRLHQAPLVAFEIARRHRFATFLAGLPDDVVVHVLPSGHTLAMDDRRQLAWRKMDDAAAMMAGAHEASRAYLDDVFGPADEGQATG